jgi:hypothetical protein
MAARRSHQAASGRAISADSGHSAPDRAGDRLHPLLDLQRMAGNQAVSRFVQEVLGAPGQPLDPATQAEMEARLGQDLGHVRVHLDAQAGASAQAMGAKAYTVGHDVVFGRGRYRPDTTAGRQLLGHELAHVVQQGRGGAPPQVHPAAVHERQADAASGAVAGTTGPVTVAGATGVGLAREVDPEVEEAIEKGVRPSDTPDEPIRPSRPGEPAPVGPQRALTPTELIDEHVLGPRALEEVGRLKSRLAQLERLLEKQPGDAQLKQRVEAMRERIGTQIRALEGPGLDPQATGRNLTGHGNLTTRAVVQLVDADGNLITLARGEVSPNVRHAEEAALAKLRRQLGTRRLPPGTRMNVAGNQVVCEEVCKPAIKQFAEDYGIRPEDIDTTVRQRPRMQGEGLTSPKTQERTGLRSNVPKGTDTTTPLFGAGGPSGGPGQGTASPKRKAPRSKKPASKAPAAKAKTPKTPASPAPAPPSQQATPQAATATPKPAPAATTAPPGTTTPPSAHTSAAPGTGPTAAAKPPTKTGQVAAPKFSLRMPKLNFRVPAGMVGGSLALLVAGYFISKHLTQPAVERLVQRQTKILEPRIEQRMREEFDRVVALGWAATSPRLPYYMYVTIDVYRMGVFESELLDYDWGSPAVSIVHVLASPLLYGEGQWGPKDPWPSGWQGHFERTMPGVIIDHDFYTNRYSFESLIEQ